MIEILLPVYNGEKYLSGQIDSILAQTYKDWILKIRNDGSTDNSQEIIDSYCKRYPNKIFQIKSPSENVGLVQSLNYLADADPHCDYIAFSDQDDIWLPNKLEISLNKLKCLELNNINKPIMVCTDATCVDSKLNVISKSFFKSQKFPYQNLSDIEKMIALNEIQGCTILINRIALNKTFPLPNIMTIHDMWIGINCAYYGIAHYIHNPTILYRQHSSNVAGQLNINSKYYLNRILRIKYTLSFILRLKKNLNFRINLPKILYYKILYMFKRI